MSATFKRDDVKKHNTNTDAWVIIEGKVYDLSKFLEQHPGGEEVLLDVAGRDATTDFNDVGHSEEAHKLMKDYYKGEVDPSEKEATKTKKDTKSTTTTKPAEPASNALTFVIPALILGAAVVAYFYL